MRYFKDKWAIVTGGASGIGLDMTRILVDHEAYPVVIDNNERHLEECNAYFKNKKTRPITFNMDLSKSNDRLRLCEELVKKDIKVDILINNVAIGYFAKFVDLNWEEISKIIDVNLVCTTHLCRLFLPDMIKKGGGAVLNVSSTASLVPCPNIATYAATKAFMNSLTESLSAELYGLGIKISYVIPGATETGFFKSARMDDLDYVKNVSKMSSREVALQCLQALVNDKKGYVVGMKNKFNMFVSKMLPASILRRICVRRFR